MKEWDKYYPKERFQIPETGKQYQSPYDVPTVELQDLVTRKVDPFQVVTLNLATAGSGVEINIPGQAVVAYGFATADGFQRTVNTTASIQMFLETTDPGPNPATAGTPAKPGFPLKHARGYRGPFTKMKLYWIAQAGVSVDLVIHRFVGHPWIDGESAT